MAEKRATSIRRGSAGGGTGPMYQGRQPAVQSAVIQKKGISYANPLRGLTQIGANQAARLNQMGGEVNQFFGGLAGTAMKAADVQHKVDLAEIRRQNIEEQRLALSDELQGKPDDFRPELKTDRDYFETRLQIRAGIAASEEVTNYVTNVLPNQGVGTDPSQGWTDHLNTVVGNMPDDDYKSFYISAATKAAMPAIEQHYAKLFQAEQAKAQNELSVKIQDSFNSQQGSQRFSNEVLSGLIADAQAVLPAHMQVTPGAVRAWVYGQAMRTFQSNTDPHGLTHFLTQLSTDKSLGDGEKTFSQLFPNQYQSLVSLAPKLINKQMESQAKVAALEISELTTAVLDITATAEDRNAAATALHTMLSNPHLDDFTSYSSVNQARRSAFTALNDFNKNAAAMVAVGNYYAGGLPPSQKAVTETVESNPAAFVANNPEIASFLIGKGDYDTPGFDRLMKDSLMNPNVLSTNDAVSGPAVLRASAAYFILNTAATQYGMTRSQIRKKFGAAAVDVWDSVHDDITAGMAVGDALYAAIERTESGDYSKNLEALPTNMEPEVRRAFKVDKNKPWFEGIRDELGDAFGIDGDDINVQGGFFNDLMLDVRRDLASSGKTLTPENIKDAFNRSISSMNLLYSPVPDGDEVYLIHRSQFSKAQARMFDRVPVGDGFRTGIEEGPKALGAVIGKLTFGGDFSGQPLAPFLATLTGGEFAIGGITNPQSRTDGTVPLKGQDGQLIVLGLDPTTNTRVIEFEGEPRAIRQALGIHIGRAGDLARENAQITLVPDANAPTLTDEEALRLIQTGGAKYEPGQFDHQAGTLSGSEIGMSQFQRVFNSVFEPLYGFQFVSRNYLGQTALTLEYSGTVPTEAELDAIRKDAEANYQVPLTFSEKVSASQRSIPLSGRPDTVRATLDQARAADVVQREEIRQQWRDVGRSIAGTAESLSSWVRDGWGIVGRSVLRRTEAKAVEAEAQTQSDLNVATVTDLVEDGIAQGQVRSSVGVTVLDLIPERINSAEEANEVYVNILRSEAERKGGIPNEREDTPLDETYAKLRNDLIFAGEGREKFAYSDTSGIPTAGIGFNLMDGDVAKTVVDVVGQDKFDQMLVDANQRTDSDKKAALTDEQMNRIFETVILEKERVVSRWYKGVPLTPVQRAVIVDLAYQGGSRFVGPNTNFYRSIKRGDWDTAINEVANRSNRNKVAGIQVRMDNRAQLLANSTGITLEDLRLAGIGKAATTAVEVAGNIFSSIINEVAIPTARAGEAMAGEALARVMPDSEMPKTTRQFSETTEWIDNVWKKAAESKELLVQAAIDLGADAAAITAMSLTPTDSSGLLFSDWILKNRFGIPVDRRTFTEGDLKPVNMAVLRDLAQIALSKGRNNITWEDYGTTIVGGVPISGIIGGKQHHQEADKIFPKNPWGYALLGLTTMVDPKVDVALTIGQASLSRDREGNLILTDTYDAQRFLHGSRSDGAYGAMRDFVEGRVTSEADDTEVARPIQFRVNLGKLGG